MKILGIDYGKAKVGLALADDNVKLAYPLSVLRFKERSDLEEKIKAVVEKEEVEKVVIGLPEGVFRREIEDFGARLKRKLNIPIVFWDETLTTKEAQTLSIEAGIKRKKRKSLEDAYAASIILESYLESKG